VDAGDARGELECRGALEQQRGVDERVAADGLGDPQRPEAQLLDQPGERGGVSGGHGVERPGPDAHSPQVHGGRAHWWFPSVVRPIIRSGPRARRPLLRRSSGRHREHPGRDGALLRRAVETQLDLVEQRCVVVGVDQLHLPVDDVDPVEEPEVDLTVGGLLGDRSAERAPAEETLDESGVAHDPHVGHRCRRSMKLASSFSRVWTRKSFPALRSGATWAISGYTTPASGWIIALWASNSFSEYVRNHSRTMRSTSSAFGSTSGSAVMAW